MARSVSMLGKLAGVLNTLLAPFNAHIVRKPTDNRLAYGAGLLPVSAPGQGAELQEKNRILNLLGYTKSSESPYSAATFQSAYHSVRLFGETIRGQRDPAARLDTVPFDFAGKRVLDIGCNQGGMLFAVADRAASGVGIDFDYRMINAANRYRAHSEHHHLGFYVFDLEKEPLALIDSFLGSSRLDIVFLLSVAMWIRNWREVIDKCRQLAPNLLFETNGSDEEQAEQKAYLASCYPRIVVVRSDSPDDPLQPRRQLLLCSRDE
jgi:SAM-dependent methyltransferase